MSEKGHLFFVFFIRIKVAIYFLKKVVIYFATSIKYSIFAAEKRDIGFG